MLGQLLPSCARQCNSPLGWPGPGLVPQGVAVAEIQCLQGWSGVEEEKTAALDSCGSNERHHVIFRMLYCVQELYTQYTYIRHELPV